MGACLWCVAPVACRARRSPRVFAKSREGAGRWWAASAGPGRDASPSRSPIRVSCRRWKRWEMRHINAAVKKCLRQGIPVISVDTKKKELVGNYENAGRQWLAAKQPRKVQGHAFPGPDVPRAYPYGIYDIGRNAGFVNVGTDHDTGAFAVASIRGWWRIEGRRLYAGAKTILITADGGGSNGWRLRLWKLELQKFADQTGLCLAVST